jgi:hypothetical protein
MPVLLINLFAASIAFAAAIWCGWMVALLAWIFAGAAAMCVAVGWRAYILRSEPNLATAPQRAKRGSKKTLQVFTAMRKSIFGP